MLRCLIDKNREPHWMSSELPRTCSTYPELVTIPADICHPKLFYCSVGTECSWPQVIEDRLDSKKRQNWELLINATENHRLFQFTKENELFTRFISNSATHSQCVIVVPIVVSRINSGFPQIHRTTKLKPLLDLRFMHFTI